MGLPAATPTYVSPEEYLVAERRAETKHEYWDGEIQPMSGAGFTHNRIAANLTGEVGVQLKGKSCLVVGNDHRVQVLSESTFVYPDVTVVCGQPLSEDNTKPDTLLNPTLLVEILAASTKSHDRGDKFFLYCQLPTLQQYWLLDSQRVHAESHTRDAQSRWILTKTTDLQAVLPLGSVGCEILLADVYAGLTLG